MSLQRLVDLLMSLFGAEELRRLVRYNFEGVEGQLPGANASPAALADAVGRELEKRGLIDDALFELLRQERPRRAAEIQKVQDLFAGAAVGPSRAPQVVPPAVFEWLRGDALKRVYRAAIDANLAKDEAINALAAGIDPAYVAQITVGGATNVRLLTMLNAMNGVRALKDGCVPMAKWLDNAVMLTMGSASEAVFAEALAAVQLGASAPGAVPVGGTPADVL